MNIPQDVVVRYIKTKNKVRKIATYRSDDCKLKAYHQKVANFVNDNFINSIFAKAYVTHQSIYINAKAHMYNDYFIMMDIENFFNKINHNNLVEKLYLELNRQNKETITKKECLDIVDNCSINKIGIPLGFITSPVLSNIYLKEFDGILYGKLKKMYLENIIYTRYADDLCISFRSNDCNKEKEYEIINITKDLLKRYKLKLNTKKTRSYDINTTNHVKITGVNIIRSNDNYRTLSVGRKVKNSLFWDAVKCYKNPDRTSHDINKIKGMQSFILSIEKNGYEGCYSENMVNLLNKLGFTCLKELIDNLSV